MPPPLCRLLMVRRLGAGSWWCVLEPAPGGASLLEPAPGGASLGAGSWWCALWSRLLVVRPFWSRLLVVRPCWSRLLVVRPCRSRLLVVRSCRSRLLAARACRRRLVIKNSVANCGSFLWDLCRDRAPLSETTPSGTPSGTRAQPHRKTNQTSQASPSLFVRRNSNTSPSSLGDLSLIVGLPQQSHF